jgi:hypothetical protein
MAASASIGVDLVGYEKALEQIKQLGKGFDELKEKGGSIASVWVTVTKSASDTAKGVDESAIPQRRMFRFINIKFHWRTVRHLSL